MGKNKTTGKVSGANQKVAERKQEVFKKARKLTKPLTPNRKKVLIITIGIILASIVVLLLSFALLIYRYKSDSDLVYRVTSIVPYPAAKVDGSTVTYGEYLFELRTSKRVYEYLQTTNAQSADTSTEVDYTTPEGMERLKGLRQTALEDAKKAEIVRILAEEANIEISREELNRETELEIDKNGGEKKFNEVIASIFGWDLDDFKKKKEIQLLQQKLAPSLSTEQKELAESVLSRVKSGEDFSNLAKEFSQDPGSRETGGDLGLKGEGVFVPQFEEVAFKLEPGEVSDIVETEFGFHIIKSIEKKDGQFRVAHILIQYQSVDELIQARLDNSSIKEYLKF
jgi:hypothetical protein